MKKKKKRNSENIFMLCYLLVLFCFCVAAMIFLFKGFSTEHENAVQIEEGFERQSEEEKIADNFINWLLEHADELDEKETNKADKETDGEPKETETPPSVDWFDTAYLERDGILLTPEYAKGYLAFVLEYPNIGIRRGVYSADTYKEITVDFDNWMTVLYNPYQRLGRTNLFIMGHNSLTQNLSFNNVRQSKIGDHFYLYAASGVYDYEITNIFCEWREAVRDKYMGRTDLGADICHIATCGRDDIFLPNGQSTRYRDYILEGHLVKHYTLSEYGKLLIDDETNWRK